MASVSAVHIIIILHTRLWDGLAITLHAIRNKRIIMTMVLLLLVFFAILCHWAFAYLFTKASVLGSFIYFILQMTWALVNQHARGEKLTIIMARTKLNWLCTDTRCMSATCGDKLRRYRVCTGGTSNTRDVSSVLSLMENMEWIRLYWLDFWLPHFLFVC